MTITTLMQYTIKLISHTQAPLDLLLEADPSVEKINAYLPHSHCYAAITSINQICGLYVLTPHSSNTIELMNLAVYPDHQKQGIGTTLLKHAIQTARSRHYHTLTLGTGIFGYQLPFYQSLGFTPTYSIPNYFLNHYSKIIYESGKQHHHMTCLSYSLE
ncbi:putative N-acetyltransferase YvbK [Poriferisphaera corsica]|uniref:Putative N-acetyltransferase YvbK n=1 Tax=Poriferisphaera corsica TaxID=2528020 RepID=A0A517YRJ0_9BACT|nr:GNAT family N-acetyltransferase [Poriferisphaera corsica]QDU32824.1 putative N-acetyltransferase YvbK [Poriferisphaera corsica]